MFTLGREQNFFGGRGQLKRSRPYPSVCGVGNVTSRHLVQCIEDSFIMEGYKEQVDGRTHRQVLDTLSLTISHPNSCTLSAGLFDAWEEKIVQMGYLSRGFRSNPDLWVTKSFMLCLLACLFPLGFPVLLSFSGTFCNNAS